MTTTIVPSQGAGIDFVQQGIGASPGYAALDVRRAFGLALASGCIGSAYGTGAGSGAYAVTQRGAGANMSVDIAASTGGGLLIQGTSIGNQGLYVVAPHNGIINETIAAADATNPRVDQIIVRAYDNAIDVSGKNTAETSVLTGTPTSGATIGIGGNRNGAAALPPNAYRLADVLVPALSSSVTNANIFDRRPKTRGHTNISASESRTNVAYGTLTTPDQVNEIVLPTDGLIAVAFQGTWQESVQGAARAAIFLNANQLKMATQSANVASTEAAAINQPTVNINQPLGSFPLGLGSAAVSSGYTGDVATGQIVGVSNLTYDDGGVIRAASNGVDGGPCYIFASAGTYHISVQFKSSSGSITASNRKLWVWTMAPDQAVLA